MKLLDFQEKAFGENFPAALLVLGGTALAVHYEQLSNTFHVPPIIHDFHNGGPLGRSGNEPHQSEASKATIFISESGRVEKHANVFQIYLACRVVLVSLA